MIYDRHRSPCTPLVLAAAFRNGHGARERCTMVRDRAIDEPGSIVTHLARFVSISQWTEEPALSHCSWRSACGTWNFQLPRQQRPLQA